LVALTSFPEIRLIKLKYHGNLRNKVQFDWQVFANSRNILSDYNTQPNKRKEQPHKPKMEPENFLQNLMTEVSRELGRPVESMGQFTDKYVERAYIQIETKLA
jgi:hypothetical protein